MGCSPQLSRLCNLINDALCPYTEQDPLQLTKEKENDLLIILSKVSREIQRLGIELECDSKNETVANPESELHSEGHSCLAKIVSVLIIFLKVGSQYVQHLAGNVLVVISNFIAKSGSRWDGFLHLLCLCLEMGISNILSSSSFSSKPGTTDSDSAALNSILILQPRLVNANWHTVASLSRVLRNILKYMKQNYGGELLEIYMESISCCLSNVPWDLLDEVHAGKNDEASISSIGVALPLGNFGSPESRFLFLGNLVQLFCSLVESNGLVDVAGGSLEKHLVLDKITLLVPKLLNWCFCKQGNCNSTCIYQYLRHKMLMLMIKLSFQVHWECSTLVLWLQLLHDYFQDLLLQPISARDTGFHDCLDGSPFLVSVTDGTHEIFPRHLQRRAIFLFLKCSFSLISLGEETDKKCGCATSNSCLTRELQSGLECCNRKKGLLELSEWLHRHLPLEAFVDYSDYLEKCSVFASSFLQLFMDEDDLLFEMLLQLLTLPFPAEQVETYKNFQEVRGDILFHVTSIFNPVRLFHLFLAELHYDHLVLLDYLISKDTGINCVQYLLRCFRLVFKSWHLFVEFSVCGSEISQPTCKKRKVFLDRSDSHEKIDIPSAPMKGGEILALEREWKKNYSLGRNRYNKRQQSFENAKGCLLSLKKSVKNLHQKNLFPYNPAALLRSFMRFEELCHQ